MNRTLVAYFSASGVTEKVAERLAETIGNLKRKLQKVMYIM